MKKGVLFMAIVLLLLALAGGNAGKVQAADDLVINEENFPAEWLRNLLKTKYYDLDGNGVLSGQEIKEIGIVTNYVDLALPSGFELMGGYTGVSSATMISGTDLSGKDALDTRGLEKLVFCGVLRLAEITCEKFTVSPCPKSLEIVSLANADINMLEIAGEGVECVYFPECDEGEGIGWRYNGDIPPASGIVPVPVNHVRQLDVSQCPKLKYLRCDSPTLTKIDVSQNKKLEQLSCEGNQLTGLDLSNNTKLERLRCRYNHLTELDLRQNRLLKIIIANDNQLTSLDTSKLVELIDLDVENNQLKKLDVSQNKKLRILSCKQNQLKKLDLSKNKKLQWVSCRQNKIKTLALPDVNWRKYATNEEASVYGDDYYSLFGQNPIDILDLRTVSDFRKFKKKTVLQFMNGKYNWWEEEEHNSYQEKQIPLRKIKKLVISRKLSGSDRSWLTKQAKKNKVKIVYR